MPAYDIAQLKGTHRRHAEASALTAPMHPSWLRGDHAPHGMEIELPVDRGVSSLCRIAGLFDPRENKGE